MDFTYIYDEYKNVIGLIGWRTVMEGIESYWVGGQEYSYMSGGYYYDIFDLEGNIIATCSTSGETYENYVSSFGEDAFVVFTQRIYNDDEWGTIIYDVFDVRQRCFVLKNLKISSDPPGYEGQDYCPCFISGKKAIVGRYYKKLYSDESVQYDDVYLFYVDKNEWVKIDQAEYDRMIAERPKIIYGKYYSGYGGYFDKEDLALQYGCTLSVGGQWNYADSYFGCGDDDYGYKVGDFRYAWYSDGFYKGYRDLNGYKRYDEYFEEWAAYIEGWDLYMKWVTEDSWVWRESVFTFLDD